MEVTVVVHDYSAREGLRLSWQPGHELSVTIDGDEVAIKANAAGLVSLANHLLTLAQEGVPAGEHLHLDPSNSLQDGSAQLIIERS